MPTRGSKDPNGRALRGRRAHTTFALLTDPARQIWNSFNNRANAGGADAPEAAVNGCLYDRFKSLYNKTATKPSLVIVPARFKSGTLYSQIPSSNADFTVTRPLNTATRFDSSALIQTGITSGVPRLDYYTSGGTAGCPALLVEPSGTNLAFHSETWASGNNWQLTNITRTTGSTDAFKAPDGTFTANAISPTSGNLAHYFLGNIITQIAYTSGTIYTQSAFFKQGTGVAGRYVQLVPAGSRFTQLSYANFDLQLGTVTVVSGSSADANRTARIENYGNGWYRCSITATCNASGSSFGVTPALITTSGDTRFQAFSGTVTDVLYGWGAQLETGSVATSYIPTTTAAVTRNADVVSVSGAVSGSIGQTEGTIYAEVDLRNLGVAGAIVCVQTASFISGTVRIQLQASNQLFVSISDASGTTQYSNTISSPTLSAGINKIALSYSSVASGVVTALNGSIIDTGTASFGTLGANRVYLGAREASGSFSLFFNNRIRAVALYTTRLTNDELQSLTKL